MKQRDTGILSDYSNLEIQETIEKLNNESELTSNDYGLCWACVSKELQRRIDNGEGTGDTSKILAIIDNLCEQNRN